MEKTLWPDQQENQWIDKARAGDLTAFNQLVLLYQDAAFRVAGWMVRDDAGAEDIVQTVFLTAYRRIGSFRNNNFRAWLLSMIRNACIDELRRRKSHLCFALEPRNSGGEDPGQPIETRPTPEEKLIHCEDCGWIEQCLRRLPESMRDVIMLIDIENLDYAEAANTLGIPLGTVKRRLGRARARMRDILSNEHEEPERSKSQVVGAARVWQEKAKLVECHFFEVTISNCIVKNGFRIN